MIQTSTTKWCSTQHPRQHCSRETASTMHDLLQTLALTTTWNSARHEKQLYDVWFSKAFYDHYDARQHSTYDTASTMRDLLKNQWSFNIFDFFSTFSKMVNHRFFWLQNFPRPLADRISKYMHASCGKQILLNPTIRSRALITFIPRPAQIILTLTARLTPTAKVILLSESDSRLY